MISVRNISKSFSVPNHQGAVTALRNVSFELAPGEVLGLIGPSGAGKSTALRSLNLLERPDSGSVFFEERDLLKFKPRELREARQKIGMIFQNFNLLANQTVGENVALPLRIAGWNENAIQVRVREVLTIVQLQEKVAAYPAQLSGGQRQRVAIARGIANSPKLLLADEPTSALDPLTKNEVLLCLERLNRDLQLTIAIATHEMSVVKRLCTRALLFNQHRVEEEIFITNGNFEPRTEFGRTFVEAAQ